MPQLQSALASGRGMAISRSSRLQRYGLTVWGLGSMVRYECFDQGSEVWVVYKLTLARTARAPRWSMIGVEAYGPRERKRGPVDSVKGL